MRVLEADESFTVGPLVPNEVSGEKEKEEKGEKKKNLCSTLTQSELLHLFLECCC